MTAYEDPRGIAKMHGTGDPSLLRPEPEGGAIQDQAVGYGSRELDEFKRQERDFATAWRRGGHPCVEVGLLGLNHVTVSHAFANP